MATQWFYMQGDQKVGPISSGELKQLASSGNLVPSDLVWKEGLEEWVAAERVETLFASIPSPPPIPPPVSQTNSDGETPSHSETLTAPSNTSPEMNPVQGVGLYRRPSAAEQAANRKWLYGICAAIAGLWLICSWGCREHPKVSAFRNIVKKFDSFPNKMAGDKERTKFNEEMGLLINTFSDTPFDATKRPDDGITIVGLYKQRIDRRYKGHYFNVLEEEIDHIIYELQEVEGINLEKRVNSASEPFFGKVVRWVVYILWVWGTIKVARMGMSMITTEQEHFFGVCMLAFAGFLVIGLWILWKIT